jgi:hypothetical protein
VAAGDPQHRLALAAALDRLALLEVAPFGRVVASPPVGGVQRLGYAAVCPSVHNTPITLALE